HRRSIRAARTAMARERRLLRHPSVFNALAAASPLTIAPMTKGCSCTRPRPDVFGPQNAKATVFGGTKESNLRTLTMHWLLGDSHREGKSLAARSNPRQKLQIPDVRDLCLPAPGARHA